MSVLINMIDSVFVKVFCFVDTKVPARGGRRPDIFFIFKNEKTG